MKALRLAVTIAVSSVGTTLEVVSTAVAEGLH